MIFMLVTAVFLFDFLTLINKMQSMINRFFLFQGDLSPINTGFFLLK